MRIQVLSFILAVAVITSACYSALESSDAQAVSSEFLQLPDKMDAVIRRQLSPMETKQMLRELIRESCTGPLLQRLGLWVDSFPIDSHMYPDVMQEWRSQGQVRPRGSTMVQGNLARTAFAIETYEVFSLSRNLSSIDELFDSLPIVNIDREEARRALEQHTVPEIVELRVHAEKHIDLELRLFEGQWKVYEVTVHPQSATLTIPAP